MHNFNQAPLEARAGHTLTGELGAGGQAWVYDGLNPSQEPVAVKVFHTSHTEAEVDLFQNEARKLRELSASAHIIRIDYHDHIKVGAGTGQGRTELHYPYMVLERAAGGAVSKYIGKPELTTDVALAWTVQLMEGIRMAHGEFAQYPTAGVVHRDIKPDNLLIMDDYRQVKVTDFGISTKGHQTDASITKTQLLIGTFRYMPPEQFEGAAVYASDIYSTAVTAYQMLTGKLPITIEVPEGFAWYVAHKDQKPEVVGVYHPDGSINRKAIAMQQVLMKALAKKPQDRYPSMGAFQAALVEASERFDAGMSSTRYGLSRRRLLISGGTGTAAVVGLGGYLYERSNSDAKSSSDGKKDPTSPESLTPAERVKARAIKVIDECQRKGQDNDVYHLVRDLIPVDYNKAFEYVRKMSKDQRVMLLVDLAFYDPGKVETMMKTYEDAGDYSSAARIAMALAFYGKLKMNDPETTGAYISGVPQAPDRRAAYDAAERVRLNCNDTTLRDMIGTVGQTSYNYSNSGQPIDTARELLEKLRKQDQRPLVEAMCRVIARDNVEAVHDCITDYLKRASETGDYQQQTTMVGMARDLAVDLAPFSLDIVTETLNKLVAGGTPLYTDAADAVAMALAPYNPIEVRRYVSKGPARSWRQPVGIAVARQDAAFYQQFKGRVEEPVISWLQFVRNPTSTTERYAVEGLGETYFKSYAYWVVAAALKDQTKSQK